MQLIKKKDAIKAFLFVNFKLYTFELVKKIKHSLIKGVKELSMQSRIYNHFPQKEFSLNPIAWKSPSPPPPLRLSCMIPPPPPQPEF